MAKVVVRKYALAATNIILETRFVPLRGGPLSLASPALRQPSLAQAVVNSRFYLVFKT
jgi:hypothetical protein